MGVRRRLTALFAAFTLVGLPACVGTGPLLPLRPPVEIPPPPVKSTSGKSRPAVQFASLPRGPGERVPLNPVPLQPQPVPAAPPAIDPPPVITPIEPGDLPPLEVTPALVQAFQAFHDNQPEKAITHLSNFDQANQELLLQLIPAVVQAARTDLNRPDSEEAATLARQFESAAAAVLKRGGFTVRKAAVCLSVGGFGVYRPVDDAAALRKGSLYSVYLELGNVPCLPDTLPEGGKGFLTRLECEMRVTDEFGQTVEILDVKTKTPGPKSTSSKSEYTRSPLNDCYLAAVLQTPTRPGAYVVTFEVRDPRTGRSVSKPIPFRVQ